jgi:hypothetical protein
VAPAAIKSLARLHNQRKKIVAMQHLLLRVGRAPLLRASLAGPPGDLNPVSNQSLTGAPGYGLRARPSYNPRKAKLKIRARPN